MAEALLDECFNNAFLTCKICSNIFEEPKILPCLHTFCLKCLTKDQKGLKERIVCPRCRDESLNSKVNVSSLQTNLYAQNLTDLVKTKGLDSSQQKCIFCYLKGQQKNASFICLDCQDALCHECASHHNFTRITLNHKVAALDDVHAGKFDAKIRSIQIIYCQHHPREEISFFCDTCNIPVCSDCLLPSHKLHDFFTPEEALKIHKVKICELIKDLEEKLKHSIKADHHFHTQLSELEKTEENMITNVNDSATTLIENVKRESKEAKDIVRQVTAKPIEQISNVLMELSELSSDIKESVKFCVDAMQNSRGAEMLFLYNELRQRLFRLKVSSCCLNTGIDEFMLPRIQLSSHAQHKLNIFEFSKKETSKPKNLTKILDTSIQQQREINLPVDNPLAAITFVSKTSPIPYFTFIRRIKKTHVSCEPRLTSVTWMNEKEFAVVDSENKTIDKFHFDNLTDLNVASKVVEIKDPVTLTFCDKKLICGSYKKIYILSENYNVSTIYLPLALGFVSVTRNEKEYFIGRAERSSIHVYSGTKWIRCIHIKDENGKRLKVDAFSMAVNSKGEVVMFDTVSNNILVIQKDGRVKLRIIKFSQYFLLPGVLCVDAYNNILLVDHTNEYVLVFSEEGKTVTTLNTKPNISKPKCLCIGETGYLLVAGCRGYIGIYKCNY